MAKKMQIQYKDNLNLSEITESVDNSYVDLRELEDITLPLERLKTQKILPEHKQSSQAYNTLLQFKLHISLLSLLRNPSIVDHQHFNNNYLQQISYNVHHINKQPKYHPHILYLHLILSQIENLNEMEALGKHASSLPQLSKEWNQTNIMNAYCIESCISKIVVDQVEDAVLQSQLTVNIIQQEDVYFYRANAIYLSRNMIEKAMLGQGFYDIYFGPLLLTKLPFQGVFRYFSSCKNIETTQENYGKTFMEIIKDSKQIINYQEWYHNQVDKIIQGKCDLNGIRNVIANWNYNPFIEKLLIGLIGWDIESEQAVKLLNMYYDRSDWQVRSQFHPTIAQCNDKFLINYLIENTKEHRQNLMLCVKAACFNSNYNEEVFSWFRPKLIEYISDDSIFLWMQQDLGVFPKCGFYDWKLFLYRQTGKNEGVNKIINITQNKKYGSQLFRKKIHNVKRVQGRFIVHPQRTRQLQIHQIYMDNIPNDNPQSIPTFQDATREIQKVVKYGVNCVYVMGTFERDTGEFGEEIKRYRRPQASPLALTCRKTPCSMFGGPNKFLHLTSTANSLGVKVITDCTTRVSSSRMSKKYNNLILHYLDETGKKQVYYGSDGRSINFEDTLVLNYRKKQSWDLLLEEIVETVEKYGINGIYLDNGFSWPQMYQINHGEVTRKDVDNTPAYTSQQIFEGQVVIKGKKGGFWATQIKNSYPNPFLIQLCKKLWRLYPQFLIISEGFQNSHQEDKTISTIISGPIPRIFRMTQALSQIMGYKLHENGSISRTTNKTVVTLKKWYQSVKKATPRNSIIIQSTTSHTWPYPSYIYKQATWTFIDLFYFLPQIPMTFIGQFYGKVYRTNAISVFISIQGQHRQKRQGGDKGLKKIHSSFFDDPHQSTTQDSLIKGVNHTVRDPNQIKYLEQNFRKEVGPQFGFDLNLINKHYEHRCRLRNQLQLLTAGHMISVSAQHMYGIHNNVLSFAKWNQKEILLISVNFNPAAIDMHYNLSNLKYLFTNPHRSTMVVKIQDLFNQKFVDQYYTISELITSRIQLHIEKYQSSIWRIAICNEDDLDKAIASSCKRVAKSLQKQGKWIYSSIITNQLIHLVTSTNNIDYFVKRLSLIYEQLITPYNIDFSLLISKTHQFWVNKQKISKLFAIFQLIKDYPHFNEVLKKSINGILEGNKLGPIVFVTPEIGAWSSVGGLGVMVDELSKELARLGEQVYIVTPYYQYNKKNQTNYLVRDGFKYQRNIITYAAHFKYQFGVHRGKYKGVNYVWLHNPQLFSKPYDGEQPLYVSKQLIFFALAVLESFCQLQIFPSIIVTNDWMCGFVSAYVKAKKYKDIFDGTKFMHICHNLDPLYEGRLYPKIEEGDLNWLYQLPKEWYVEYRSNKLVINPSKCALETCDNWGTVSNSYKYDLLRQSPLAGVLWKHSNPFSFPNGVRKQQRLSIIQAKTPGNHLDSKKLLQQRYFGFQELNNEMPLFAFIGRVTKQKGVHLIVDSIESLLYDYNFKIQFLIGGPSDQKEQYGKYCASRMKYLTNKYPKCVWSDPDAFFTDGPLVNIGSDFAMMPSMFEPGGIVQHEFFAGGTPVVAFRTGGLKDTVFEFDPKSQKGNGFNFMSYQLEDFKNCLRRAIQCYRNKKNYQIIRKNAFDSVVEEEDVAKGWNNQFYRLQNKIYVEFDRVEAEIANLKSQQSTTQPQGQVLAIEKHSGQFWKEQWQVRKDFREVLNGAARLKATSHTFIYESSKVPRPKDVFIAGQWDQWQSKQKLHFNQLQKNWSITLKLTPGSYTYKYHVEGEWVLTSNEQVESDLTGNENHIVFVD